MKNFLLRAMLPLVACITLWSPPAFARSVVDENNVWYETIGDTKTVNVSTSNQKEFVSNAADIVIPASVVDCSTTGETGETYTVVGIEQRAFEGTSIKSIKIEIEGLTEIPYCCFNNCNSLESVEVPTSVTKFGAQAFSNTPKLMSISGTDNLQKISSCCFQNAGLINYTIPANVTLIEGNAFDGCPRLKSVTLSSGISVLYSSTFQNCPVLETVVLNEGLTEIQKSCFGNCKSLQAPAFPSTLTVIKEYAFTGCKSLGDLKFDYPAQADQKLKVEQHAFELCGISSIEWSAYAIDFDNAPFFHVETLEEVTIPGWMTKAPNSMFAEAVDLRKVTVLDGVDTLESLFCEKCYKLEELILAQSVNTIGNSAFSYCKLLKDPVFPNEMTLIDRFAFEYCESLRDLVLPAGAEVGGYAFRYTNNLTSITFPEQAMGAFGELPFGNQSYVTELNIPGWMKELPFSMCSSWPALKKVTLGEGVEKISPSCFYQCTQLETINFPTTLKYISNAAFYGGELMVVPDLSATSLVEIGDAAFQKCNKLTELVLPATITKVGTSAFANCENLVSANLNCPLLKETGLSMLANSKKLANVLLVEGLELLSGGTFTGCESLNHPKLPSTLKIVGKQAFSYCKSLKDIELMAGVQYGEEAYAYTSTQEGEGITSIKFPEEPCEFDKRVFYNNYNIRELVIPKWMKRIHWGTFAEWSKLEKLTLHDELESIDSIAFQNCTKLHDVEFPASLKKIDHWAFEGCNYFHTDDLGVEHRFGKVKLNDNMKVCDRAFRNCTITELELGCDIEFGGGVFENVTTIESIIFPSCMTDIPEGFCNGWTSLKSVYIPEGVTYIGRNAFFGCTELERIHFPSTLTFVSTGAFMNSGLTHIDFPANTCGFGEAAFCNCDNLTSIVIPAYMEKISKRMFEGCDNLSSVTYEDREWDKTYNFKIEERAFNTCYGLTEINLPNVPTELDTQVYNWCTNVTKINFTDAPLYMKGVGCFESCQGLKNLVIPDNVMDIGEAAFRRCLNMETIDLGKGVTKIGKEAFSFAGLTDVTWSSNLYQIGESSFQYNDLTEITIPGTVSSVGGNAFAHNEHLTKLTIEEGVTELGSGAFSFCDLSKIELPSSMRKLVGSTFNNNKNLKDVVLNEGLELIGEQCFANSNELEMLELPTSLKEIKSEVVKNCPKCTKIVSHALALTIGESAFSSNWYLKQFISDGNVVSIGRYAFNDTPVFEEFRYSGDPIKNVGQQAFYNAKSLKEFPYLSEAYIDQQAFEGCTSLKQLILPSGGRAFADEWHSPAAVARNCASLQSFTWAYEGGFFKMTGDDFANCPLQALSYSYSVDMDQSEDKHGSYVTYPAFPAYSNPNGYQVGSVDAEGNNKSKLMVKRGQKWKYHEKGYDQVFDIIEMKDPQFNIEGDLYCDYDQVNNINNYKVYLRWEVPLSDLDQTKDTQVTVYRDKKPIGTVTFKKPLEKAYNSKYNREVIEVPVEFDGQQTEVKGDLLFPIKKSDGTTIWQKTEMSQGSSMYFDAYTHKRLDSFDNITFKSWYVMLDEFVSDDLGDGGIPRQYNYTAKMKPYTYLEYENYDNLIPQNGEYYRLVENTYEGKESDENPVYVAMAMPSMEFQGLYTTDEVMQDLAHGINDSSSVDYHGYRVTYDIDPSIAGMQWRKSPNDEENLIYDKVEAYEYDDNSDSWNLVATINLDGETNIHGEIDLGTAGNPAPGKKYRTIVRTSENYRGTYGSPIMTVPDAPKVKAILNVQYPQHLWDVAPYFRETHHHVVYEANLTLYPEQDDSFSETGYDSFKDMKMMGHSLDDGDYFIGVWRKTADTTPVYGAPRRIQALSNEPDELIYHADGRPEDATDSHCGDCSSGVGEVTTSETGVSVKDTYDIPWDHDHDVEYRARVYMKVPDSMLRGDTRWMMAEVTPSMELGMPTIVEGVLTDGSERMQERWFDMQGFEVKTPESGKPYIRVCGGRSERVVR